MSLLVTRALGYILYRQRVREQIARDRAEREKEQQYCKRSPRVVNHQSPRSIPAVDCRSAITSNTSTQCISIFYGMS